VAKSGALALTVLWWIQWRDVKPVQSALIEAHAEHLSSLVKHAVAENRRQGRRPSTYSELANMLDRNWTNVWRWRTSEKAPSVQDMLCLASLLQIPVAKLFQSESDQIAGATRILCEREIEPFEATAYASYCLAKQVVTNDDLDSGVVKDIAIKMGKDPLQAQRGIWHVVDRLEPVLQSVCAASLDERLAERTRISVDVTRRSLSIIRFGRTTYHLRQPAQGVFAPSPTGTVGGEFVVEGFDRAIIGSGSKPDDAYNDWVTKFHTTFQRLFVMRPFEMNDADGHVWGLIEGLIDVERYRASQPLVVRQVGKVSRARPYPQVITWEDGTRERVHLKRMPGENCCVLLRRPPEPTTGRSLRRFEKGATARAFHCPPPTAHPR
jgi:hypothetical protein